MPDTKPDLLRHKYVTLTDLPEELRAHYVPPTETMPFAWFHHPLYVSLMPMLLPESLPEVIARRQQRADQYLEDGDIGGYVFSHERAYRMTKLISLANDVVFVQSVATGSVDKTWGAKFWKAAGEVWVDAEHDESDYIWSELLECTSFVPDIEYMMEFSPRVRLRAAQQADQTFTLYRGVQGTDAEEAHHNATQGYSWTGVEKTARFFANRFLREPMKPYIACAQIPAKDVLLWLTQRSEDEHVVDPLNISPEDITVTAVEK